MSMISWNEYLFLKKIEKNKMAEEILDISCQPDFIYDLEVVEMSDKLANPDGYNRQKYDDEISKKDRKKLVLISRLLKRKLIAKETKILKRVEGVDHVFNYFEITDYGYNSMIEYRMRYKFWLPLAISILSVVLSVVI